MLNQHKVDFEHQGAANALFDTTGAVILNEMLDEGLIYFWGQGTHAWGDEWNWNFWFGSENHADFVADWDEYVSRISERYPDVWGDFAAYSKAHKDNLYNLRYAK
jgi:hypothetical protein